MMAVLALLETVFAKTLLLSAMASVLILLLLAVRRLLRNRISPDWLYLLWLPLLLRLLLPWTPASPVSVFNLLPLESHLELGQTDANGTLDWGRLMIPRTLVPSSPGESLPNSSAPASLSRETPLSPSILQEAGEAPAAANPTADDPVIGATRIPFPAFTVAAMLWLAGCGALLTAMAVTGLRFRARIGSDAATPSPDIQRLFEECRREMKVTRPIALLQTDRVGVPTLFGPFRLKLLLPISCWQTLRIEEVRHIFLHELAHVKRRDIPLNLIAGLLLAAHWFNPFLHSALRLMREDQETACDALAMTRLAPGERKEYGLTILKLAERLASPLLLIEAARMSTSRKELRRRMTLIAKPRQGSLASTLAGLAALLVLTGCTLTGAKLSGTQSPVSAAASSVPPSGPSASAAPTAASASEDTLTLQSGKYTLTVKPVDSSSLGMDHSFTIKTGDQEQAYLWRYGGAGATPSLEEADVTGDGQPEIVVHVPIGSGTGVSVHDVHILRADTLQELPVQDPIEALNKRIRSSITVHEDHTDVDVELDGKHVSRVYTYGKSSWGNGVGFGSIVSYDVADGRLRSLLAGQASMSEFPVQVVVEYDHSLKLQAAALSYGGNFSLPLREEAIREQLKRKLPVQDWTLSKDREGVHYTVSFPAPTDGGEALILKVNPLTGTVHDQTSGSPLFNLVNEEAPSLYELTNGTKYQAALQGLIQPLLKAAGLKPAAADDGFAGFEGDGSVLLDVVQDGKAFTVKLDPFVGQWEVKP
ncbi:M56 family metallopeptidase [Gorillibacterium sp. CAU 1737]|uniref:M56 family metallopeptidase n=1 Tax=Gorillibacterium sp. CAU 1737 TaxID=3140362 RepID=UPI00326135C1